MTHFQDLFFTVVYLITLTMCPWFDVLICLLVHNISFFSLWRDIRFVLFLWYMLIGTLIIFLLNDPQNITIRLMLCIYIVYRSRPSSSGQTQFIILRHHNDFIHQVLDKYCLLFATRRSNASSSRQTRAFRAGAHPIGTVLQWTDWWNMPFIVGRYTAQWLAITYFTGPFRL